MKTLILNKADCAICTTKKTRKNTKKKLEQADRQDRKAEGVGLTCKKEINNYFIYLPSYPGNPGNPVIIFFILISSLCSCVFSLWCKLHRMSCRLQQVSNGAAYHFELWILNSGFLLFWIMKYGFLYRAFLS